MADAQRVSYAEGQRITADDLTSEQLYLLALDARHNLGGHAPGMALGLAPSTNPFGDAVVTAGIAIDEQGRELLSNSDVLSPAAPDAKCVDLWIVYCLKPLPQRRPGTYDCSPSAFARWLEFGKIVATSRDANSVPAPPFEGAVYLASVNCAAADVGYLALKGGKITDPASRAWMQVGPATGRDRYGFLLTTTDAAGAPHPKLAIDRQGRNTLWGDVSLLGYQADALLPSPAAGFLLKAVARIPGDLGEQIRARLAPLPGNAGGQALGLSFLFEGKPVGDMLQLARGAQDLRKQLDEFNKKSKLVTLSLVGEAPDQDQANDAGSPSNNLLTAQDTRLTATGGSLELRKWPDPIAPPATPKLRGCRSETVQDTPSQWPNGISFTPPAQPPQRTPRPGVSAASLTGSGVQITQFRLDLGAKKDNDPLRRLTIGAPDKDHKLTPWLTADGTGNLILGVDPNQIPAPPPPKTPPISLNVTGRIRPAPIQPDPTDPRFPALLVRAWLHGLQSAVQASTVVSLTLSGLPSLIESNKPWAYQVTAANSGGVDVTADKLFETRVIAGQTLLTNVANQTVIKAGGSQTFNIKHAAGDMGVTGSLSLEVRMSGKIGNLPWWKAFQAAPIPVVSSPALDITNLPASAPPHADFEYSFSVTNDANVAIRLDSVTVTEGAGAPRTLAIPVTNLGPNDDQTFGPLSHTGGINADLPVQLAVQFTWAGGPASGATANKTIRALKDLDIEIRNIDPDPIINGNPWSYDLVLTNVGNQLLTLAHAGGIEQQIDGVGALAPVSLGGTDLDLRPNQSHTVTGVAGPVVAVGTHDITLVIQPTYKREARTWKPRAVTKNIHSHD